MKQYRVKSSKEAPTIMKVVAENSEGYEVVIQRIMDDYTNETREFLSRHLFDTCIRTGYLQEVASEQPVV